MAGEEKETGVHGGGEWRVDGGACLPINSISLVLRIQSLSIMAQIDLLVLTQGGG